MDRLTKEQRHRNMQNIKNKDTKIELILRSALWNHGYRYRKNYCILPGKPDIVITKYNLAIFCDSEFFHGKDWDDLQNQLDRGKNAEFWKKKIKANIDRDNEVDKELRLMGWRVLRFWGKDIKQNVKECVQAVDEAAFEIKMQKNEDCED